MLIYNTLTRNLDEFSVQSLPVSLYVCGITPYDTTHLGHAFTYACADLLVRYLEYQGLEVRYVQNVTDIDDDILRKAQQTRQDWYRLGSRWTAHFIRDMEALNIRPPDAYPRATEFIAGIIQQVQELLDAGVAYVAAGNVYYDTTARPDFGQLSLLSPDEMLPVANERGNNPNDPHKRLPLDFVLWQAQQPGEPAWDSPWGPGRPGWHIECSTMSTTLLGPTLDFHMGGGDLIFPHHECEIAQAEAATGQQPFVRYWMHVAMVQHEGEKMSKSLGNLVMISDLLQIYSPNTLRLYLASHHYRDSWSYSQPALDRAAEITQRLERAARLPAGEGTPLNPQPHQAAFAAALDIDLDTPNALRAIERLMEEIEASPTRSTQAAQTALVEMTSVLGLRLLDHTPEPRVTNGWSDHLVRFMLKE